MDNFFIVFTKPIFLTKLSFKQLNELGLEENFMECHKDFNNHQ